MSLKRIELTAVLYCLSLSSALAQFTSSIQGVVSDAAGAAVPEAVVHVTNVASGVGRSALTSNEGLYRVVNLGPGTYRVDVAMKGFAPAERPSVPLGISETLRADFVLKVGDLVDQVTVTEQIAQVETEEGRISARIEAVKLKELPMNGRNLFSLLAFQPGVTGRGLSGTFRGSSSAQPTHSPAKLRRRPTRTDNAESRTPSVWTVPTPTPHTATVAILPRTPTP